MCGIAGFVGPENPIALKAMGDELAHRGPDGEGFFSDPMRRVHFAHRRLAILDIDGGIQPMSLPDGRLTVIFNGEIYNHRELRSGLEARGHRFQTSHSDTEVLLHGWLEWGADLLLKLNGMFAFALFDRSKDRLLLARDRFGEKPLFWAMKNGEFVFASELGALVKHPSLEGTSIDRLAIQKLFAYSFIPGARTPLAGVQRLRPGSWLELDVSHCRRGSLAVPVERSYWRFSIVPDNAPPGDEDDWADELDHLLGKSVSSRLESDVPLGLFLSGGVDSSAILAHAADTRDPKTIDAFSIGFTEPSFDESRYAERVARQIGCNWHVNTCDLDGLRSELGALLGRIDEPMGDSSVVPTSMLCKYASESVKVALSGDGGDELFAGYDPFKILGLARTYHTMVPRKVHRAISILACRLPLSERNMSFDFKVRRGLRGLSLKPSMWNAAWLGALSGQEISELFEDEVDSETLYEEAITLWEQSDARDDANRTLEFFTNLYLPDDILVKSDRSSMLESLEVRAPFLDNDVVEFARRLPIDVKLRKGVSKWILKRSLRHRLPEDILHRPKKGFGAPIARWLRELPMPVSPRTSFLNQGVLSRRWADHAAKKCDDRGALWIWLGLDARLPRLAP
ncbi:asparagine synthase (glutamine-hydrolyzing) [Bradyrhizobium sp. DASA03068]|uniref:asparagine synthase (glutamine-hydrolyzing) n=1 Tax=Bradyrhizobium sp. BLXBL-01 TaxID=3395915 RepID=UPI003F7301F7